MRSRMLFATAIAISCFTELEAGVSRPLRERLRSQYEGRNAVVTRDGLFMASYWTNLPEGRGRKGLHANLMIFHFHDVTHIPRRLPVEFRRLDDQTFEESVATSTAPIPKGSSFVVDQVDASGEEIEFWLRSPTEGPAGIMGLTEQQIQAGARSHLGIRIKFHFRSRVLEELDAFTTVRGEVDKFFVLPEEGQPALESVALEAEIESGRRAAKEIEGRKGVLKDAVVAEYTNRVGQNLVRNSDAKLPFTIKVLNTDALEFVALPGGFVFLSRALIPLFENEAELAGVMAHAIAHGTPRHRSAAGEERPTLRRSDAGGANDAREAEADARAVQYLYNTGYDPRCYLSAMEKLNSAKGSGIEGSNSILVHLMTSERMAATQGAIAEISRAKSEYVVNTTEFEDVKGRILGLSTTQQVPPLVARPSGPPARIEIRTGMSREEVIQALGAPQKEIVFGKKTILRFAEITIELVDGKVVDLKPN